MAEIFARTVAFTAVVAALFLGGWLAACFIALEWSVPLASSGSRLWLVACAILVANSIKEW